MFNVFGMDKFKRFPKELYLTAFIFKEKQTSKFR